MKISLKRTGIVFVILCPILFILHSIAWADILFWKTGTIAMVFGIPTTILLWPLSMIPVTPGSNIDGPYFWLPLVCLLLMAWSWLIQHFVNSRLFKKRTSFFGGRFDKNKSSEQCGAEHAPPEGRGEAPRP